MKQNFWLGAIGVLLSIMLILFLGFGFYLIGLTQEIVNKNNIEQIIDPTTSTIEETIQPINPAPVETIAPTEPTESTEPILQDLFTNKIIFEWEYTMLEDLMPYMLFSPSTKPAQDLPLIVWLHGSGEKNVSFQDFGARGLPGILNNWQSEHFYAYILCPQLIGRYDTGAWYLESSRENLNALIDKIVDMYNIDTTNIIICGHSLGAQGALYMADKNPELYSKVAVFSGYHPNTAMDNIKVPIIGFVGYKELGEDEHSTRFHYNDFSYKFGEEATTWLPCGHAAVPQIAFGLDEDGNGRSDVIEWMLND